MMSVDSRGKESVQRVLLADIFVSVLGRCQVFPPSMVDMESTDGGDMMNRQVQALDLGASREPEDLLLGRVSSQL
jgi:hypothetical protein